MCDIRKKNDRPAKYGQFLLKKKKHALMYVRDGNLVYSDNLVIPFNSKLCQ